MIGSNRYFLTNYGLTRAEIDVMYDLIYNGTVESNVYIPATVDLLVQILEAIGKNTDIYTAQMGSALGTILT